MNEKKKIYLEVIIKKYNWLCDNDDRFPLEDIGLSNIKKELIKHINSIETINNSDKMIFKNYLENQPEDMLLKEFKLKEESYCKNILRLLTGETQKPQKDGLLDVCAFLVDIEPRPFDKSFDYNKIDIKKKRKKVKHVRKNKLFENITTLGLVSIVSLALVSLVIVFSLSNKEKSNTSKSSQPTITINTKNFIVSDINKIIPNQDTKFFNDNNEPQVWYASYNNEYELYNTSGIHPITNKQLQPITKEIIKTVFVEKEVVKPKNIDEEIKETNVNSKESLFNTSIVNTKNNKEISLFIFDSINKIDDAFSNHLKQELSNQKYKVTPNLILSSNLNSENIEHLKAGDLNYFNDKLQNYTDFTCTGNVSYAFSKSTIQEGQITCKMKIDYSIISSKTGETINTYNNLIAGNGSSKINAKNNTIKKFKL